MIKFNRIREGVYSSESTTQSGLPLIKIFKMTPGTRPFPKGWSAAWYVAVYRQPGNYVQWVPPYASSFRDPGEASVRAMFPTLKESQAAVNRCLSKQGGLLGGYQQAWLPGLGEA